jgi:hypothetical protein
MGSYIPEDGILHSHRRENLKSYKGGNVRMKVYDNITVPHTPLCVQCLLHTRISAEAYLSFVTVIMYRSSQTISQHFVKDKITPIFGNFLQISS